MPEPRRYIRLVDYIRDHEARHPDYWRGCWFCEVRQQAEADDPELHALRHATASASPRSTHTRAGRDTVVAPPPSLNDRIRAARGIPTQQVLRDFTARADYERTAPPPPDLNAMIRAARNQQRKSSPAPVSKPRELNEHGVPKPPNLVDLIQQSRRRG